MILEVSLLHRLLNIDGLGWQTLLWCDSEDTQIDTVV